MQSKTDKELNEIAWAIFTNQIFTHLHVNDSNLIPMIFMPLALGACIDEKDDIGLIYEYYSKSLERGINGYPIFSSCRLLNKSDTEKVLLRLVEIKKANKDFKS